MEAITLAGGLVLRAATPDDAGAIAGLAAAVFGPEDEIGVRAQLADPRVGPDRFTVVTDGDRVVSSLCLMTRRLRLSGVDLPTGQVEYVLTDPAYRRRGLVRAQIDVAHRWSADRGDVVQLIHGIPYLYRRFGYEYAVALPRWWVPAWHEAPVPPPDHEVRAATEADLPALRDLFATTTATADVVAVRDDLDWLALLRDPRMRVLVAVAGGEVRGAARLAPVGGRMLLHDVLLATTAAGRALVAAAAADGGPALRLLDRPGTILSGLLPDLAAPSLEAAYALYVRVADPVGLLERLRPALSARLAASPFVTDRGRLVLTLYTATVALDYDGGEVTAIGPVPLVEDPGEERDDEIGVPPDLVATLLLGRYGARGLADRHDDVRLGARSALADALFPRLLADV
jgi:predicted N-acetyltransferase YhbS